MNMWTLENSLVQCRVWLEDGRLLWSMTGQAAGADVQASPLSELSIAGKVCRWSRAQARTLPESDCLRELEVVTQNTDASLQLVQRIQVFQGHPFVRFSARLVNIGTAPVLLDGCSLFNLNIPVQGKPAYAMGGSTLGESRLFHVEQFSWIHRMDRFALQEVPLTPYHAVHEIRMGSFPSHHKAPTSCAWAALRQASDQPVDRRAGVVLGIEFNGKSRLKAWAEYAGSRLQSTIDALAHRLAPGTDFQVPAFFLGRYQGDWDQAAFLTHRFSEAHVYPPPPDDRFPWVQYNSWGYDRDINEESQMQAIERCGQLGLEAVVLDLGWARKIGDWHPDEAKFPRGLKPLADRARQLGMAFGLHMALAQMHPQAPIALEHPEWLINPGTEYFGAGSICLGHEPCRNWLLGELLRLVDEYGVNYFVQDGEDMVKACPRSDHTHAPGDSNYANSQRGLDLLIQELRRRRPQVVLENCEDGGCMLTFQMARHYHTSITVDNSGIYTTRQGIYGASYPFSLRYSSRYMQDAPDTYNLRSVLLGGPLILMQRITQWDAAQMAAVRSAVALYKRMREYARHARVIHLLPPNYNTAGLGFGWDAIQVVSPDGSRSAVLVFRAMAAAGKRILKLRGLTPGGVYQVRGEDRGDCGRFPAHTLTSEGFPIELAEISSEILWLERIATSGD